MHQAHTILPIAAGVAVAVVLAVVIWILDRRERRRVHEGLTWLYGRKMIVAAGGFFSPWRSYQDVEELFWSRLSAEVVVEKVEIDDSERCRLTHAAASAYVTGDYEAEVVVAISVTSAKMAVTCSASVTIVAFGETLSRMRMIDGVSFGDLVTKVIKLLIEYAPERVPNLAEAPEEDVADISMEGCE